MAYVKVKILKNNFLPECRFKIGDIVHLPEEKALKLLKMGEVEIFNVEIPELEEKKEIVEKKLKNIKN